MRHQRWIWKFVFFRQAATGLLALALVFTLAIAATQPAQAQIFTVLHTFTGGQDGGHPVAGLTMDKAGNLYGTAEEGGSGNCNGEYACGTVYRLKRSGSDFIFNPLYVFNGGSDGSFPEARVIFGPNGTLYGTTPSGGGFRRVLLSLRLRHGLQSQALFDSLQSRTLLLDGNGALSLCERRC
jgi:hypothetical protein